MRAFAPAAAAVSTCLAALALATPAQTAELPAIKASKTNVVPECVTPGRLMSYLSQRNPKLDSKFSKIAVDYMREGEALGLRWDYAFFQMIVETGSLTYKGDVKPDQNNFAGLGATGRGVRGERFADVATGVRAHLQHVAMYAGDTIENPVAERTRNVQEWRVLDKWRASITGPVTYKQMSSKWAPSSRSYPNEIAGVAAAFFDGPCKSQDPQPELLAEVRSGSGALTKVAATMSTPKPASTARPGMSSLGATDLATGDLAKAAAASLPINREAVSPEVKILNQKSPDESLALPPESDTAKVDTAALATNLKSKSAPAKPKCRVWQASYGGSKAIIIRASTSDTTNYTVLDVNEGSEKKEAEAYITAYAKGGQPIGEYNSPALALEKAFELCPEG